MEKGSTNEIKVLKWAAKIIKKSCEIRTEEECDHCPMLNCCGDYPGSWRIDDIGRESDA